jgi:hypothetical protein
MRYCVISSFSPPPQITICPPLKCRKAERRKLPLKISRLFEHGQNITLDVTFRLSSFCSRGIQKHLLLVDLSFPLLIFCHSISLQVLTFLLTPRCITSKIIFCSHRPRHVATVFLLIGEDIKTLMAVIIA